LFKLQIAGIRPPKKSPHWKQNLIRLILRNEVYKGTIGHTACNTKNPKTDKNGSTRLIWGKVELPREEWIHVPVPAIVSMGVWEAANRMLEQNKKMARRNARIPYLLTGIVHCACCGWTFTGVISQNKRGKERGFKPYCGYRCPRANYH
jgi:hypothetical protein